MKINYILKLIEVSFDYRISYKTTSFDMEDSF